MKNKYEEQIYIKKLLIEFGDNQEKLAKKLNLSPTYLSLCLSTDKAIAIEQINKIAEIYNIDRQDITNSYIAGIIQRLKKKTDKLNIDFCESIKYTLNRLEKTNDSIE